MPERIRERHEQGCLYGTYDHTCSCPSGPKRQTEVEYLKQELAEANEKIRNLTSAASSAAQTTVTAIERIQEMEKVVKAAEAWVRGGPHGALMDAVTQWEKLKKGWS
jgi:hypothetical protein